MKSKVIHVQIPVPKREKLKKWEKIFWVTKQDNKGITNQGSLQGLQLRAKGITNSGSFRDFKSGKKDQKSGQRFQIKAKRSQIGARGISNWGKDQKSVQSKIQVYSYKAMMQGTRYRNKTVDISYF